MLLAEPPVKQSASFRDPSGFVFECDGRIFRAIDQSCLDVIRDMQQTSLLAELIDDGLIVSTEIVAGSSILDQLHEAYPQYPGFLEHARIWPISYPYEWSMSMLAEAGIATLDLQMRLLEHGYSLKDATAYNIQFVNGKPVFIDIASIERPSRLDIWIGLGQFGRMFTLPLLLNCKKGSSLRSCFLANLDGVDLDQARQAFGRLELLRPGLLLDITLPYWLGNMAKGSKGDKPQSIESRETSPKAQLLNLKRLRAKLEKISRRHRPRGLWAGYNDTCSYSDQAEQSKVESVGLFLEEFEPTTVLDVGCNTGKYSLLAAESGARVVSIDNDPDSVEILYRQVREKRLPILPLCMNIANPSPAIGFCNRERPGFLERISVQCVFALAVIHHLHVSANLPVAGIRDMFADITDDYLVIEFVPTDDVMFQKLMQFRVDLYEDFTLANCIATFSERFNLIRQVPVAYSPRTLLFWKKK